MFVPVEAFVVEDASGDSDMLSGHLVAALGALVALEAVVLLAVGFVVQGVVRALDDHLANATLLSAQLENLGSSINDVTHDQGSIQFRSNSRFNSRHMISSCYPDYKYR